MSINTVLSTELCSPDLEGIKIEGAVGAKMNRFFYERVLSSEAKNIVYKEAEDAFIKQEDEIQGVYGVWQGEFWGKWMLGACSVWDYTKEEELGVFLQKVCDKLISYQREDGYLNSYKNPDFWFAADPEKTRPILGWGPCDWNWNVWCRKYTLWGLVETYSICGNDKILDSACRLADHLIKQLHDSNTKIADTGVFAGLPSSSIIKPVLRLYHETKNGKYLEFAEKIAEGFCSADDYGHGIIAKALNEELVHQWYENPPCWAKAYEMMSCFDGILDLYRATGQDKYLQAVINFHFLLKRSELNTLFGVGYNDIFNNGKNQINCITEPCDVIHWMKLCYELFRITAKSSYMDDFEMAFYNPFLAGVYQDGKWGARGVRSHGRHMTSYQIGLKHNHCCVNNMPRGFTNMAQASVLYNEDSLYISLYHEMSGDLETTFGNIKMAINGDYLCTGDVKISLNVDAKRPFTVKLRIPSWSTGTACTVNGGSVNASKYFVDINIDHSGMYDIQINFSRIIQVRKHEIPVGDTGWYMQRWDDDNQGDKELFVDKCVSTIVYGPIILAKSKQIGNSEEEMFELFNGEIKNCKLTMIDSNKVHCTFNLEYSNDSITTQTTAVCDFASASDIDSEDKKYFSVFF